MEEVWSSVHNTECLLTAGSRSWKRRRVPQHSHRDVRGQCGLMVNALCYMASVSESRRITAIVSAINFTRHVTRSTAQLMWKRRFICNCISDLLKVMYMNAQYLIIHACRAKTDGPLDSQFGVDCDGDADVYVYGRTAVITDSVSRMLIDIAKSRSCVDLSRMQHVRQNGAAYKFPCWIKLALTIPALTALLHYITLR